MSNEGSSILEKARTRTAEHLKINLEEPKQEKRIKALEKLYKKYSDESDLTSLIYSDTIKACDRLMEIHKFQMQELNNLKISNEPSWHILKVKLENVEYKFKGEIQRLEDQISVNKKLIDVVKNGYPNFSHFGSKHWRKLKEMDDKCWDNWLRALDVNKELRNTIIGWENRKTLLKISKMYIDYHIVSNANISQCFKQLKEEQKKSIKDYYETLSLYNKLPQEKLVDFKIFLQKFKESALSDSMEVKNMFMDFAESQRNQINVLIDEVHEQYERDQNDMIAVINHHKQQLINQQVLFTNESEFLILYFKKRYLEKMDLLCSRFQMYYSESVAGTKSISSQKIKTLKKIIQDEFDGCLNRLKIEFSKKTIPFLDNFWHMEQSVGNSYALDEEALKEKMMELKISKNLGLKSLVEDFEKRKNQLKDSVDKKLSLVENVDKIGISKFDEILKKLKDECESICFYIINFNARYWTRINAEFNCIFRQYFVELRHKYAPYIQSWLAGSRSWMNEYLQTNLNQELLKSIGEALEGISPESEFYGKISKSLLAFNEKTRRLLVDRDDMEFQQLKLLNTLPFPDCKLLEKEFLEKLNLRQDLYLKFLEDYNSFYREKISS